MIGTKINKVEKNMVKKMVLSNIHPGAVILLHATSKDNSNILDDCIKEIKQMGYEFRSLDQFQR